MPSPSPDWSVENYNEAIRLYHLGNLNDMDRSAMGERITYYEKDAGFPLTVDIERAWQNKPTMQEANDQAKAANEEIEFEKAADVEPGWQSEDPEAPGWMPPPSEYIEGAQQKTLSGLKSLEAYGPSFQPKGFTTEIPGSILPSWMTIQGMSPVRADATGNFQEITPQMQADVRGTNTINHYEPTLEEFKRSEWAQLMFVGVDGSSPLVKSGDKIREDYGGDVDLENMTVDSKGYKEYADRMWAEAYEEAAEAEQNGSGYALTRVELDEGPLNKVARRKFDAMGSAWAGMATLGLGTELQAERMAMESSPEMGGRRPVTADQARQELAQEQAGNPYAAGAGTLLGAFGPGAARGIATGASRMIPGAGAGASLGSRLAQGAGVGASAAYVEGGATSLARELVSEARGVDRPYDVQGELNPLAGGPATLRAGLGGLGGAAFGAVGEGASAIAARMRTQVAPGAAPGTLGSYSPAGIAGSTGKLEAPSVGLRAPDVLPPDSAVGRASGAVRGRLLEAVERVTGKAGTKFGAKHGVRKDPELEAMSREARIPGAEYADPVDAAARRFVERRGPEPLRRVASEREVARVRQQEYDRSPQGQTKHTTLPAFVGLGRYLKRINPEGDVLPSATAKPWQSRMLELSDKVEPRLSTDARPPGYVRYTWKEAREILPPTKMKEMGRKVFGQDYDAMHSGDIARVLDDTGAIDILPRKLNSKELRDSLHAVRQQASGERVSGRTDPGSKALEKGLLQSRDAFELEPGRTPITAEITDPLTGNTQRLSGWSAQEHRFSEAFGESEEILKGIGIPKGTDLRSATSEDLMVPLAQKLSRAGDGSHASVAAEKMWRKLFIGDPAAQREADMIVALGSYQKLRGGSKVIHASLNSGLRPNIRANMGTDKDLGMLDYMVLHADPIFRALGRRVGEKGAPRITGDEVVNAWLQVPTSTRALVKNINRMGASSLKDAASLRGGTTAALATPTVDDISVLVGLMETHRALKKEGAYGNQAATLGNME